MADFWSFLYQTGTASLVAALLLLLKRLFRDKLSPRWQYAVCGVLAMRILLPAGRRALLDWRLPLEAFKTYVESGASALSGPYEITRVAAPIPLFPQGLAAPRSLTDWLFYLYAAGVLATALWFFCSYLRLRRTLRRGAPSPEDRIAQLNRVCGVYGLKPCPMVEVEGLETAFVCGPLRPILALPAGVPVDDKVLLHELLHLKYGDVWLSVALCFLRCLHWCNPLLWYCCDLAQNDGEALCDQRVLERLEGEDRRDYGRILLSMADDRHTRTPGTSSMANGGQNIKARIACIARFKRYPAGMSLASGCVAALLIAGCVVGTAPAQAVDGLSSIFPMSAYARTYRASTVAGALDTYAKALLQENGVYLAMVTPVNRHEALFAQIRGQHLESGLPGYQDDDSGVGYLIYNLWEEPDGSATAYVAFLRKLGGRSLQVWHHVRVARGDGWEITLLDAGVTPLENISYSMHEIPPLLTYRGEGARWTAEAALVTFQEVGGNTQAVSGMSTFFSGVNYVTTPLLGAEFASSSTRTYITARFTGTPEERAAARYAAIYYGIDRPGEAQHDFPEHADFSGDKFSAHNTVTGINSACQALSPGWDGMITSGFRDSYDGKKGNYKPPASYTAALYRNGAWDETIQIYPVKEAGA